MAAFLLVAITCSAQTQTAQPFQNALALEEQGRIADAEIAWHDYLKTHPGDADAYAHLGMLAARQEHFDQAISYDRKALALKPSVGVRLNLGLALFKSGDMDGAIAVFAPLRRNVHLPPEEMSRVSTLLGLAHYGKGDYGSAIPYLRTATQHDPANLAFRLLLAHSCLWTKQYQCVLDTYHEILSLNAESAEAYLLAGEAYDAMKNDAGAMEQFRAAVKADPRLPNVHFALGFTLWRVGRYDEAADEFRSELANDADHAQALSYLADIHVRLSQPTTALPLLERANRIQPDLALTHLDLGMVYAELGRNEEALSELELAARLAPEDQNVHWRLARLYKTAGRNAEAQVEVEKTRRIQRAADQTIFDQLHQAQSRPPNSQSLRFDAARTPSNPQEK